MAIKKCVNLSHLDFSFAQQQKHFFHDLSAEFAVHTINFIQGKNGAGKSTLLQIFSGKMGHEHNLRGKLQIDDQVYDLSQSQQIAEKVAFVAQNFNEMLVNAYSFYENLQCARIAHYPSMAMMQKPQPLPELIEKYAIDYHVPVSLLSGGQRQILSILMVLERSPNILLLDEPTAALDEENTKLVMDFLQDLCRYKEMTIVAIVHNQELVEKYAPTGYFQLVSYEGLRALQFVSLVE